MNSSTRRIITRIFLLLVLLALLPIGFGSGGFTSQELCADGQACKRQDGSACLIGPEVVWDYRSYSVSE
jgi:hypothetical protein